MNAEILAEAGIDYGRGVKRFMGRAHLFEKALNKFLEDTTFSRMANARAVGDGEQLFASAHEFKGMCGNIALDALYNAANALVEALRGGDCAPARTEELYARLEAEYRSACLAIRAAREGGV